MHYSGFNSLADCFFFFFSFPFAINGIIKTIGNLNTLSKTSNFPGTTLEFEDLNI